MACVEDQDPLCIIFTVVQHSKSTKGYTKETKAKRRWFDMYTEWAPNYMCACCIAKQLYCLN